MEKRHRAEVVPLRRRARPCPVCGAPAVAKSRPFCSPRCADIDLGKWLKGGYRIETDEAPGDGETDSPSTPNPGSGHQ